MRKTNILLIILTLISIILFVFSALYLQASEPLKAVPEKLLEPFNGAIDTNLIEELKKAQSSN